MDMSYYTLSHNLNIQMKNTYLIFILIVAFLFTCNPTRGQIEQLIPNYKEAVSHPQMKLLNQYGNYPVNLSTGLVDISIPIYEITSGDLKLPVSISFHSSGLKANETESSLGVRWVLNTGGMVSRNIKGYPDQKYPFKQGINSSFKPDFLTLFGTTWTEGQNDPGSLSLIAGLSDPSYYNKSIEYEDTEYDIFSYNLPNGKNGKFILRDSANIKIPSLMPYEPYKIKVLDRDFSGYLGFEITDEIGTTYKYSVVESNTDSQFIGWYLKNIVSANKCDTITLEYALKRRQSTYWSDYVDAYDFVEANTSYDDEDFRDIVSSEIGWHIPNREFSANYLLNDDFLISKIKFKSGALEFNYTNGNNAYLTSIILKNSTNNQIVRDFNFDIRLGLNGDMKFLKKMVSKGYINGVSVDEEVHQFEYYDSADIPKYDNLGKYADWWGYYTHLGGRKILSESLALYNLPSSFLPVYVAIGGNANRNSNGNDMTMGMIKKIHYPTGGNSEFKYEANKFNNTECGGLRIKEIKNYSGIGNYEIKRYEYGEDGNASFMPEYLYSKELFNPPYWNNRFDERKVEKLGYEVIRLDGNVSSPPILKGGPTINYSYVIRTFTGEYPKQYFDFQQNIVYYNKVTELEGDVSSETGKSVYHYRNKIPDYGEYVFRADNYRHYPNVKYIDPIDFWDTNVLIGKEIYKKENGSYLLVKQNNYEYKTFQKQEIYDLPVFQYKHFICYPYNFSPSNSDLSNMANYAVYVAYLERDNIFGYQIRKYTIGANRLSKETERTYTSQGEILSEKTINYESSYLLPIKETVKGSGNNQNISYTYTYPFQYSQNIYKGMTIKNMLNKVIEKIYSKNDSFLYKTINNYQQWAPNIYAPVNFQYQTQGASVETRLEYEYNNLGQLQIAIKDGFQCVIYLRNALSEPLAVIDMSEYSKVESMLGKAFIERLSKSYSVNNDDMKTLDNLRLSLPNALITTYTYKPLVGMTSMTDPRDVTTTYEYDAFGRLSKVKDANGKVINTYDYHYQRPLLLTPIINP